MFRFLAFHWEPQDSEQELTTRNRAHSVMKGNPMWRKAFETRGVIVLFVASPTTRSIAVSLPDNTGVILGVIFRREDESHIEVQTQISHLGNAECARILHSRGRRLIDSFWGRFLAILCERSTHTHFIINSPASETPCYYADQQSERVYFSHLQDYLPLSDWPLEIDWGYIGMHLLIPRHTQRTALHGLTELRPGMCVEASGRRHELKTYWSTYSVSRRERIYDPQYAASALRSMVKFCVRSWASCHNRIILNLSGGLDSSILAGCLRDAPTRPHVTALNYYATGVEEDESPLARSVAEFCRFDVISRERCPDLSLDALFSLPTSPRPVSIALSLDHFHADEVLARHLGADAIYSGHGGDELFFRKAHEYGPGDFVYDQGLRRSLLPIAAASARCKQGTAWGTLYNALRQGLLTQPWSPLAPDEVRSAFPLVNADVCALFDRRQWDLWTWPRTTADAAPGTIRQAFLLEEPIDFFGPLTQWSSPEQFSPLLSQPVIELALSIPSYLYSPDGVNRHLARTAFRSDIPPEVERRLSKGHVEDWAESWLLRDRQTICDRILEGHLVRRGLLNKTLISEALSGSLAGITTVADIYSILEVEAWICNTMRVSSGCTQRSGDGRLLYDRELGTFHTQT